MDETDSRSNRDVCSGNRCDSLEKSDLGQTESCVLGGAFLHDTISVLHPCGKRKQPLECTSR